MANSNKRLLLLVVFAFAATIANCADIFNSVDNLNVKLDNGNYGDPEDFPYIAHIGYRVHSQRELCIGAIVHRRWVLTTTGCNRNWHIPRLYTIVVGLGKQSNEIGMRYDVSRIIMDPNYPNQSFVNNFLLMKTNASIQMSEQVRAIPLYTRDVDDQHDALVARWKTVSLEVFSLNI